MKDLRIFIGYDSHQPDAYEVAKHSIELFSSDITITPIIQSQLRKENKYWRENDELASTEFSMTRFLVPHLSNYTGWSLFVDSDIIFLDHPKNLFELANDKYAVMCVKHDYKPITTLKMINKKQHLYPRKNWSSVVLYNCSHQSNRILTPDLISSKKPSMFFHRFSWLSDDEIGELGYEWNWLVDWYKESDSLKPKLLHYTEGGPWLKEYENCSYSNEWFNLRRNIK